MTLVSFKRYYKPGVRVTLAGQTVEDIPLPLEASPQGPRIVFSVGRTLTSTPDSCRVSIYNLAPERRQAMSDLFHELGRVSMRIDCGYDGIVAPLFTGDVRTMEASRRYDLDFITEATADDAGDVLADITMSIPGNVAAAGLDADSMIEIALQAIRLGGGALGSGRTGQDIQRHPSVARALADAPLAGSTYTIVSIGKASDLLTEAARLCRCRWFIRNGLLYFARRGRPTDEEAVELPRDHWVTEPSEDGSGVMRVSAFCDPNIEPGRQIQLVGRTSATSRENFRIETTTHSGDTEGGVWQCSVTMRRLGDRVL